MDVLPASAIPAHDDAMVVRIREGLRAHVVNNMTWEPVIPMHWHAHRMGEPCNVDCRK